MQPETPLRRVLHQLGRLRYQLLGGLVFAVCMPVLMRWGLTAQGWTTPTQINTLMGSAIAFVAGVFLLRELGGLPGVRRTYYVIPAVALTYLAVLTAFFFLRIDYNRLQLPLSCALAIIWMFAVYMAAPRFLQFRIGLVPGGDVASLAGLGQIDWQPLERPVLERGRWDGVAADLRVEHTQAWERFLADCALSGVRVFHTKQLKESLTGRVEIEHLSENTLGSLNPDSTYLKIKQVVDWLVALATIIVFLPITLVIALAIKIDSPGPVFFRQERVGFRGQRFKVLKFRTMTHAPAAQNAREAAITRKADPRITRLGHVLRRTRFDELPQVFNILRGEMSWIGPRPEAVPLSQWYESELPFYRYRHIVRPGISGWAQVNQGHVAAIDQVLEKLHYDFYYIKNFSLWLDVLIVMRTIRTVFTGFGAK